MKIALNMERVGTVFGGAEKYAAVLAHHLAGAGHEVHVVARQVQPGALAETVTVRPVRLWPVPGAKWLRAYRFACASERLLRADDFDLILGFDKTWYQHAHLALGGVHQATLDHSARRFRSSSGRIFWRLGKLLSAKQWVFRAIAEKQFCSGNSPLVVAPSRMVAGHYRRYFHLPEERIAVVYNGLDDSTVPADAVVARRAFRGRHGLGDDEIAVLFVAHNYALKGLEPLLEAFARVARHQPRVRLVVCGSSRDRPYRRQTEALGVADRVRFLGFIRGVAECYAGCDVFAFPTFYDSCSLVVLEAMQAGLPVVTTRQNGAAELMVHGRHGFLIDSPWALEQMQDALVRLVADEALRHEMAAQAAEAAKGFSIERRLAELTAVLLPLAARGRPEPLARNVA